MNELQDISVFINVNNSENASIHFCHLSAWFLFCRVSLRNHSPGAHLLLSAVGKACRFTGSPGLSEGQKCLLMAQKLLDQMESLVGKVFMLNEKLPHSWSPVSLSGLRVVIMHLSLLLFLVALLRTPRGEGPFGMLIKWSVRTGSGVSSPGLGARQGAVWE